MTVVLIEPSQSDAATIVEVGSEVTGNEATNLQDAQPRHPWIASDTANAWVIWDQGSAKQVRSCALIRANVGVSGGDSVQVRWRFDDTLATIRDTPGSASGDSGLEDFWMESGLEDEGVVDNLVDLGDTGFATRYVRVDVTGLAGLGNLRVGRAMFGPGRRYNGFGQNLGDSYGGQIDFVRTAGDSLIPRDTLTWDTKRAEIRGLTEAQKGDLRRLLKRIGFSTGIVIGETGGTERAEAFIYGLTARAADFPLIQGTDRYDAKFDIMEWP